MRLKTALFQPLLVCAWLFSLACALHAVSEEFVTIAEEWWREQTDSGADTDADIERISGTLQAEDLWRHVNSSTPFVLRMPPQLASSDGLAQLFARGTVENPFDRRGKSGAKAIKEVFLECASCPVKAYRLVVAGPSQMLLDAKFVPDTALSLHAERQRLWMWCGRSDKRTKAHYDPFEGFVNVIRGKKRFTLHAPWEMVSSDAADARCQAKQVEVQEGELLFIPAFYYHSVVSMGIEREAKTGCDEVLSVTSWFRPAGPLQRRIASARSMSH